jgi:diaminopimelate epimerase
MTELSFCKYHGAGNDFILIDQRLHRFDLHSGQISFLCKQHLGIGADGLILLREHPEFDFEMLYYNSDGLPGTMCGNGGRVISAFACDLGLGTQFSFLASDGEHRAEIIESRAEGDYLVKLSLTSQRTWVLLNSNEVYLNTGSPHHVKFVSDTESVDVSSEGFAIRHSERYHPEGVNVNFVSILDRQMSCRTFERGVEAETLSCGTGVAAVALAAKLMHGIESPVNIKTRGGSLMVEFSYQNQEFKDIWLTGPAQRVFCGILKL